MIPIVRDSTSLLPSDLLTVNRAVSVQRGNVMNEVVLGQRNGNISARSNYPCRIAGLIDFSSRDQFVAFTKRRETVWYIRGRNEYSV